MTIPYDHIKFSDDRTTAWLVTEGNPIHPPTYWAKFDRPCDACGGSGDEMIDSMLAVGVPGGQYPIGPCGDCGGSGRHCFEIAFETLEKRWSGGRKLTVSVGMVLPIIDGFTGDTPRPFIHLPTRQVIQGSGGNGLWPYTITLPSAAAPGMWAVKLEVHP